jgi:hypothetical protein
VSPASRSIRMHPRSSLTQRPNTICYSTKQSRGVSILLAEHFRCAGIVTEFIAHRSAVKQPGFFRFGGGTICFGDCSSGATASSPNQPLHDAFQHTIIDRRSIDLSFDPVQVIDNLRYERYRRPSSRVRTLLESVTARKLYYMARPSLRTVGRRAVQRLYFRGWEKLPFPKWPVDCTVEDIFESLLALAMRSEETDRLPFIWFWPDGAKSCTLITHDVETAAGEHSCHKLMDLDDSFEIKSSFQIIPEGTYRVTDSNLSYIRNRGFEINVHDLNHDGMLMTNKDQFLQRVRKINEYGRQFGALGFRSGVMYRNAEWCRELHFAYDMSVPNVAHLDAQRGGCCTVLPYFVGDLLVLPVTTTQDYSLFHILNEYSLRLWMEQISLIRRKNGLIHFVIHPDYVVTPAARRIYTGLLALVDDLRRRRETWVALPKSVNEWWRQRQNMSLVHGPSGWGIVGEGSERARLAYAVLDGNTVRYELSAV